MIGSKVKLTKKYARWYLSNPDIFYTSRGTVNDTCDTIMQASLATLLDVPIVGKVVGIGAEKDFNNGHYYKIEFETVFGYWYAYYDVGSHVVRVN